jgi:hypothetical protein
MKTFIKTILLVVGITLTSASLSNETTRVCVDVKDNKGNVVKDAKGNPKQNCKEMKVHKKLEGTQVPEKK